MPLLKRIRRIAFIFAPLAMFLVAEGAKWRPH